MTCQHHSHASLTNKAAVIAAWFVEYRARSDRIAYLEPPPRRRRQTSLSANALQIIIDLSQAIEPILRPAFRAALSLLLASYTPQQLTPRLISQLGQALQREFLRPPISVE
jgi:hypothetical protein